MRWCVACVASLFCGQDEGHDEAVEPQHLGEDQDEDHAHEEPGLLGGAPHAGVAHDADGEPGRQAAQAHAQACAEVQEAPVGGGNRKDSFTLYPSDSRPQRLGSGRGSADGHQGERHGWPGASRKNFTGCLMGKNISVWKYFKKESSWT